MREKGEDEENKNETVFWCLDVNDRVLDAADGIFGSVCFLYFITELGN